jgi:hypothetical protein
MRRKRVTRPQQPGRVEQFEYDEEYDDDAFEKDEEDKPKKKDLGNIFSTLGKNKKSRIT